MSQILKYAIAVVLWLVIAAILYSAGVRSPVPIIIVGFVLAILFGKNPG